MNQVQKSRIMPTLCYADVRKAIEWLCNAFGFELHVVYEDDTGSVVHAELKRGGDMIMLGQLKPDGFGRFQKTPAETQGIVTQSAYIVIDDVKPLHDHVVSLGASIVMPLSQESYGQMFSCLDPEGHLWNFGDYDPWK